MICHPAYLPALGCSSLQCAGYDSVIQRLNLTSFDLTTIAGSFQQYAFVNGVGPAARFRGPGFGVLEPNGTFLVVVRVKG